MSLRVWLPLDGDLRNQGISDLNTINMPSSATVDNTGKIGKCYTSSGAASGVSTNLSFSASQFSIAAWVRINTRVNAWRCPFKLINSTAGDYIGFCCEHNTQATYIGFHFYKTIDGTNTSIFDAYPITDMTVGVWTHLVVTYDGKVATYYKDGIKVSSTTVAVARQNTVANIDRIIMLGSDGGRGGAAVKSSLNDVRIYDHCLSAAEIKEIAQGLVLHYKLDEGNENLLLDTPKSHSSTAYNAYQFDMKENLITGQTYTLQLWDVTVEHSAKTAAQMNLCVYWGGGNVRLYNFNGTSVFTTLTDHYAYSPYLCAQITPTEANASGSGATNKWLNIYNSVSNADGTRNMKIGAWKLEKGAVATQWVSSSADMTKIQDSSGYNRNGEILNGPLSLTSGTPRYNISTHFSATNQKIKISNFPTSGFGNSYTFTWWAKISSVTPMHWGFSDGIRLNGMYTGRLWNTGDSSNNPLYTPGTTTQVSAPTTGVWHHWAMTGDGTKCRVYQDGVLWAEAKIYKAISGTTIYINGWDNGTNYSSDNYSISDFRIYCTPLLDTDIKQLYNVGMKIDKSYNIHTYELHQEDENKLHRTGVLSNSNFNEINNLFNLLYDKQLYIEPDGSCWIRIFHHANCDTKLFVSSDTFTTSVYKDADRWFNVSLCNKVNKWELMVKSMPTAGGTETKYRWIQTKNPMTAAYADVAAASVTKVTGNGYASYGWGGLYHIGSSTYLSTNNGTNGNWWGAVGAWANHQDGIPGWTTVITTGYEDVYLRIDNLDQVNLHAKNIKAGMWTANQFIEK